MNKTYLGDGVYAEFDGFSLILTAENGIEATDTIVLEPEVYTALTAYVAMALNQLMTPPTVYDSGLCCMARHANAPPPWMCDCQCHKQVPDSMAMNILG